MKSYVIISLDVEGFHFYPHAPDEVAFLASRHRHLFKITVHFSVTDLNREVEIFIEQWKLSKYIASAFGCPAEFNDRSCEQIAVSIIAAYQRGLISSAQVASCEVLEDGKGGAVVYA